MNKTKLCDCKKCTPSEPPKDKLCAVCGQAAKLSNGAFWCSTKGCKNCGPIGENQITAEPVAGETKHTNRHGEPCSKECGEGRHSACKQSMFDGCNCTCRGGHTVPHRYANIGDGLASTPLPVDLEEKLRELQDRMTAKGYWNHAPYLREAAALVRAGALEEAAKICEDDIRNQHGEVRHYRVVPFAEAIRALKEKG